MTLTMTPFWKLRSLRPPTPLSPGMSTFFAWWSSAESVSSLQRL